MNRFLAFLLLLITVDISSYSQSLYSELGTPFIRHYTTKEIGGQVQNWAITQTNEGTIYVGNNSGCFEYDGVTWRAILMPNLSLVRSLVLGKDNTVYVGAANELGYLAPDSSGQTTFVSLTNYIQEEDRNFDDVWSTFASNDAVYFQSRNYVFVWKDNKMTTYKAETSFHFANYVHGNYYVRQRKIGLMQFEDGKFELVPGGEILANKGFFGMLPLDNRRSLILAKDGLYVYDENSIVPFNNDINDKLASSQMYHGSILPDDNIAIATFYSGLFILSPSGEFLYNLNKSTGLQDNYIVYTFVDRQGALWLALNDGISRVEIPSSFSQFTESTGLKGMVQSVIRFESKLYVATNIGLFVLESEKESFTQIELPASTQATECWSLCQVGDMLLLATSHKLLSIKDNKVNSIINDEYYFTKLYQSRTFQNRVYAGLSNGIAVFTYENGKWKDEGIIEKVDGAIIRLAEEKSGVLWATAQLNGLFRIQTSQNKNIDEWKVEHFGTDDGLPSQKENMAFNVCKKVVFATNDGVYRFDENTSTFKKDSTYGSEFTQSGKKVFLFVEDYKGNIWSESEKNEIEFAKASLQEDGSYRFITEPLNRLKEFVAQTIYPELNGVVWMGGAQGLVKYDPRVRRNYNAEFASLIRFVVTIEEDSIVYGGYPDQKYEPPLLEFEYEHNSLSFEFTATSYDNVNANRYQYYLQDFDKGWSEWTSENKKDYTNIPEGQYLFRVRAKNIYGKLSREAFYKFVILPPWYRTWWAYSISVILFVAFVFGIVKVRSAKLVKEKEHLEEIVAERTSEILKQKEEIAAEKDKADKLLYNILPVEIADELKEKGTTFPRRHEDITILFTDFKGFTNTVATMPAKKLVDELNEIFKNFDDIIANHNLEKIKTIGDAYLIAGGLPKESPNHAQNCVNAAREMLELIEKRNETAAIKWQMRVGIHSGAVVAGVVGKRKFTYDVWGDTVNIASRMESSGIPGKINVSAYTYDLVKSEMECEYRGKVDIKGKGEIDMYFVK